MTDKPKVSERFERAFDSGGSGLVRDCVCGRVHFGIDGDWGDGEREELLKKKKRYPAKYFQHEDFVSTYVIYGDEIVMGCPCATGAKYEQFIIRHASQIATYLNDRAKSLADEANAITVKEMQE